MIYAFVTIFPGKRDREQQIALSLPHFHRPYSLDQSARKKKCLLSGKKNCVWRFVNQQKIRYFNLLGLAFRFMRHYT